MYIKVHKTGERQILAVSDEDILGKKFEDDKLCLYVSEDFYKGKKVNPKKLQSLLENYDNINIVGKKSIKLALKINIIRKENIIKIQGVPHAQVFTI